MEYTRWAAALGVLGFLCTPSAGLAQRGPLAVEPVSRVASIGNGSIQGIVNDERGNPLAGAMVSALGATSAFAVTDKTGRFELRTLSPGPYLLRAHLSGFQTSRGQIVDVRASSRASSTISLHRASSENIPIMTAGIGGETPDAVAAVGDDVPPAHTASTPGDDHGETAWRLRHVRRGVLKDSDLDAIVADDEPSPDAAIFGPMSGLGRAVSSPARAASSLFAGTPFSGQVNLLTTGSFDTPQQLFSSDSFGGGVAYVSVGAPVGDHGDWTMRGALTQGDIASWIVAGSYSARASDRHHYELGLSYATQRYDGGNPAALRAMTDGSRNAGAVYGHDTWALTPALSVMYGGRYDWYDYLAGKTLVSPRAGVTFTPIERLRISAVVASRADAPGAEEFLPPAEGDLWLPPQRTFAPLADGRPLVAERTTHGEVDVEHDIAGSTLTLRAFRQHVTNQSVVLFGLDLAGSPEAAVGHYDVSNNGGVDVVGWSAGWRAAIAGRVHGAIEYSESRADWNPAADLAYMILYAPSAIRQAPERIHDVSASVETQVPETATRVLFVYRLSNGFAQPDSDRPGVDGRFDLQVRQSLPFMNFSAAQWEMLVAVRNFFHEAAAEQSVYDELLVVHPPKRIVGGLALRF